MQRLFLFSIFFSLFSVVMSQIPYSEKHPNGNIRVKGRILADSTRIGNWKFYYETGKLKIEAEYSKGAETGIWKYYYPNGDLWKEEAKIDGDVKAWYSYPNSMEYSGTMKNGKMHGVWEYWWDNGNKQSEQFYNEGSKTAQWKFWYEDGKEWKIISMEKGPVIIYDTTDANSKSGKLLKAK